MRIAVLGAGRMGVKHTRAYQGIEGVDVAGIVGRTAEKVETVSADLGIPGWTDPGRILEDRTIDAIDIAVPSDQHRVYAESALSHDKHVFCETPMTLTLEDADAIVAATRSSQKIFGVALLMRFVADMDYVSQRLRSGEAGAPIAAIGSRLSPPYSSGGKDEHYGDPIIELMLFELDILVRLFGMPSSVTASSASPDVLGHVLATFSWDGFHVQLEATNQMPESHPFRTYFRLICENETIESEFTVRNGQFGGGLFRYPSDGEREQIEIGHDPYQKECEYFVQCVRGETDPTFISAEEARRSIALSFAVRESLSKGGLPVSIDEIGGSSGR